MRARIEAGTDIAMVGAWDASCNKSLLAKRWGKEFEQTLESDARDGQIFLIHTGGDGGGPIDIFIDEDIPAALRKTIRSKRSEFLLRVPSGQIVVGGVEDYRTNKPQITGPESVVKIPAGDYMLKCFVGVEETISNPPPKAELEKAVGADNLRYYNRVEKQGCMGYLTLLLFPLLWPLIGWLLAAIITFVVVLAFFNIRETWFLKRNKRYQRIQKAVNEAFLKARVGDSPNFVLQLRKVEFMPELKGGSLRLG